VRDVMRVKYYSIRMECLRLRVKDIDFEINEIRVRNAKGNKDRQSE
jgi:integrase